MPPIISVPIYAVLTAFTGWLTDACLLKWLAARAVGLRKFWLPPYVLLALLPVAGAFLPNSATKFALQAAGNIWLGFFLYYGFVLLILSALAALLRRGFGSAVCVAAVAAAALLGYGLIHAQNTVVVRYDVNVEKPVTGVKEMKLALLADLHLSVNSSLDTTKRMVELVNAEQPDAVVIAGDIFTSSYAGVSHPEAYAEALRGLQSKYGVYAVYGNHDVEETLFGGFPISPIREAFRTPEMERFCADAGFTMLLDETVTLGGTVQLVGRIDGEKAGDGTTHRMSEAEVLANVDQSLPVVVLQHEPRGFAALRAAGADVALCGHTHAGQIFPGNLIIPFFNENAWGYKVLGELDTVVTSGVGYYGPPIRVGTNSEVTIVTLHFE